MERKVIINTINMFEDDDLRNDFLRCFIEMEEILKDLPNQKAFDILNKTVEIAYKSVIETHRKTRPPKEVMKAAFNQNHHTVKNFIKLWQKGELPENF